MVNIDLLEKRIRDSGMTMVTIAKKCGILRETLYNRLKGRGEFKASEILKLSEVLRLSVKERDSIFFAPISELKSTDNEITKKEG